MDLKEKFTGKQLTIIIVAICAVFIFLGILTMVAGSDDESSSDNNTSSDIKVLSMEFHFHR